MQRLDGKVALVTGSARRGSIGRAIILALAEEGADIAINDFKREKEAEEAVEAIRKLTRKALIVMGDVSKVPECRRIVQETVDFFGRLDIAVVIGGLEIVLKLILYYFHERFWNRVSWGKIIVEEGIHGSGAS